MADQCFPPFVLCEFAAGKLSLEEIDEVAVHLATCLICRAAADAYAKDDELVRTLRVRTNCEEFFDEAACIAIVSNLLSRTQGSCESIRDN